MNSPPEVADNLERLAADAQRRALAQLSFCAATLGLLIECTRWTPDDAASLVSCVEGFQARSTDGLSALGDMQRYRRALDSLKSETVSDVPAATPAVPADRSAKLDELRDAMVAAAVSASGDLSVLSDLLQNGSAQSVNALVAAMQSFAQRSEELQLMFAQAGEVAGCDGSA